MLCPLSCSCNHSIVTTGVFVVVVFWVFLVSLYPYSLNWSKIDLFNDAINTF